MNRHKLAFLGVLMILCTYVSPILAGELRKLGTNDMEMGQTDGGAQEYVTSPGGATVTKWDGNDIPWTNEYTRTIRPGDIITKGPWVDVRATSGCGNILDNTTDGSACLLAAVALIPSTGGEVLIPGYLALGSNVQITGKTNLTISGIKGKSGIRPLNNGTLSNGLASPTSTFLVVIDNSTNVTIQNLDFDIRNVTATPIGVYRTTGFYYKNNSVIGEARTDIGVCAIHTSGLTNSEYVLNTIDNTSVGFCNGTGASGELDNNVLYLGNTFTKQKGNPIIGTMHNASLVGNKFLGYSIKIKIAGTPSASVLAENIVLSSNIFSWVTSDSIQTEGAFFGSGDAAGGGIGAKNITIGKSNTFVNAPTCINVQEASQVNISGTFRNCTTAINTAAVDNLVITGFNIITTSIAGDGISTQGDTSYGTSKGGDILIADGTIDIVGDGSGSGTKRGIYMLHDNVTASPNVKISNVKVRSYNNAIQIAAGYENVSVKNNDLTSTNQNPLSFADNTCTAARMFEVYGNNYNGGAVSWSSSDCGFWYGMNGEKQSFGAAAPTRGTWAVGDFRRNSGTDNVLGWKNTVAGSPGTFKSMTITLEP